MIINRFERSSISIAFTNSSRPNISIRKPLIVRRRIKNALITPMDKKFLLHLASPIRIFSNGLRYRPEVEIGLGKLGIDDAPLPSR